MTTLEDGKTILTYDEAVKFLPKGKQIHTFIEGPGMLIGADWGRKQVLNLLRMANGRKNVRDRIEATGPGAQGMKHGLAVWRHPEDHGSVVFIETTKPTIGMGA